MSGAIFDLTMSVGFCLALLFWMMVFTLVRRLRGPR